MKYLKTGLLWLMGALYIAAGIYHFVDPAFYVKIMPPYSPGIWSSSISAAWPRSCWELWC